MKATHTYALLELSPRAYHEIAERLRAAGYEAAFHDDGDAGVVLDMQGLAVAREQGDTITRAGDASIEIGSILSQRTKRGMVELALNNESTQMDLDKAREVVGMLQAAIEAAITDELIVGFFTARGLSIEDATRLLADFRELRQGSRDVVRAH